MKFQYHHPLCEDHRLNIQHLTNMNTTLFQSGVEDTWRMVLTFKWRRVLRLLEIFPDVILFLRAKWYFSIQRRRGEMEGGGIGRSFAQWIHQNFYISFFWRFLLRRKWVLFQHFCKCRTLSNSWSGRTTRNYILRFKVLRRAEMVVERKRSKFL